MLARFVLAIGALIVVVFATTVAVATAGALAGLIFLFFTVVAMLNLLLNK